LGVDFFATDEPLQARIDASRLQIIILTQVATYLSKTKVKAKNTGFLYKNSVI